jgi:hypothetical protein
MSVRVLKIVTGCLYFLCTHPLLCFCQQGQGSARLDFGQTFTVPASVTQITIEAMSQGGYGGRFGGGGGGGGGFAKGVYTVVPGSTLSLTYRSDTIWIKPWIYVTAGAPGKAGNDAVEPGKGGKGGKGWGGNISNGFGGDGGMGTPYIFGGGGGGAAGIVGNGFNGSSAPTTAPSSTWTGSAGGAGGGGLAGAGGTGGIFNYGTYIGRQGEYYGSGGGGGTGDNAGSGVQGYAHVAWGSCYTPPPPTVFGGSPFACDNETFTLSTHGYEPVIWVSDTLNNTLLATGTVFQTTVLKKDTFFFVRSIGECGNMSSATKNFLYLIEVNKISATAYPGKVCYGSTYTLSATGAENYAWANGTFTTSATITGTYSGPGVSTGSIVVQGSWSYNNCKSYDTLSVLFCGKPTFNYIASKTNCCLGDTVKLYGEGPSLSTCKWNNGASGFTTSVVVPAIPKFWATVTDTNGCHQQYDVQLNNLSPVIKALCSTATSCREEPIMLSAYGASSFTWSTGQTGSQLTLVPEGTATYTVAGTSGACISTTTIQHVVTECTTINEKGQEALSVYPNPTTGQITLTLAKKCAIRVVTSDGRLAKHFAAEKGVNELKLDLPPGLYFLFSPGTLPYKIVVTQDER